MLGITVADAIVVGTLIGATILALLGKKAGDTAKKEVPPDPVTSGIAAVFADKDLITRQAMALESIASTLKEIVGIQTDEHERAVEDRLERIEAAVLKKQDDDDRANRTASRVESTFKKPRRD